MRLLAATALLSLITTAHAILIPGLVLPAGATRTLSTSGNTAAVRALRKTISDFTCTRMETWTLRGQDVEEILMVIANHPKNQHLSFYDFPFAGIDNLGAVHSLNINSSKAYYHAVLWTYRGKIILNLCTE